MPAGRIYFFAYADDLKLVLKPLERELGIEYLEDNLLRGPKPEIWMHCEDLPSFGKATADQEIACQSFLLQQAGRTPVVQTMLMSNGETRFDVFQNANPETVLFRAGGERIGGELISGHFIVSSEVAFARLLMRRIRKGVKEHFTRIRAFWVGPRALAAFDSGTRLCNAIQSPPEYDLRRE